MRNNDIRVIMNGCNRNGAQRYAGQIYDESCGRFLSVSSRISRRGARKAAEKIVAGNTVAMKFLQLAATR